MTLAQARALCPGESGGLSHAPHDPAADARGLVALGRWLVRFSPVVSPEPPDAVFLDVTGCERLYGGLDNLARQVGEALGRLGVGHRIAIAPTPGAAWALAGEMQNDECRMQNERQNGERHWSSIHHSSFSILHSLPPWALRLDPATAATLHHLGIETIGQLLALPRDALAERFGPGLLRRIDQAFGRCPEPLTPLAHAAPIRARLEFGGPVEALETLWLAFKELIGRVLTPLARRGAGARQVDVEFRRPAGPPVRKTVSLSRPSRDAGNLFNLLRCALETVRADEGFEGLNGFTEVRLAVPVYERLAEEQGLLVDGERRAAEGDLTHLIERLVVRLGQEAVVRPELRQSHLPERAVGTGLAAPVVAGGRLFMGAGDAARLSSPKSGVAPTGVRKLVKRTADRASRATQASPLRAPRVPRPLHLLPAPREVRATAGPSHDGDGPPLAFADGVDVHRIAHAAGPERIAGVWWDGHHKARDYYDVEDAAGRRFWVFRVVQTGKWYLHGEYE
jgi:protein ImuB